jgi:hypothetical protein
MRFEVYCDGYLRYQEELSVAFGSTFTVSRFVVVCGDNIPPVAAAKLSRPRTVQKLPTQAPASRFAAAIAPAATHRYCDVGHRVQRHLHPQPALVLSCHGPHFSPW